LAPAFVDVGWGSDVATCRQALPHAFLNLRLSPVRMLQCAPQEIAKDTEKLLLAAGPLERVGVCCINMDAGTPDDNRMPCSVVRRYRPMGGWYTWNYSSRPPAWVSLSGCPWPDRGQP
jgi:hypothetical protein